MSDKELSVFIVLSKPPFSLQSHVQIARGRLINVAIINTTKGCMQTVPDSSYDRLDYAVGGWDDQWPEDNGRQDRPSAFFITGSLSNLRFRVQDAQMRRTRACQ